MGRAELWCSKSKNETTRLGDAPGEGQVGFQEKALPTEGGGALNSSTGNGYDFLNFYFTFSIAFQWSWEPKNVQEVLKESCFQIM